MPALLFGWLLTGGKWFWSFATSRIGSTILIAIAAYFYGHHVGFDAEKAKWQASIQQEIAREQQATVQIEKAATARAQKAEQANAALRLRVNEYVEKFAQQSTQRPVSGKATKVPGVSGCSLTDDDVRSLRGIAGSASVKSAKSAE